MDDILNEVEQEKVIAFCKDDVLREAVRKVLLAGVYQNGTLRKGFPANATMNFLLAGLQVEGITNEELGADLRAAAEGIRVVESAFKRLETYKSAPQEPEVKENPSI